MFESGTVLPWTLVIIWEWLCWQYLVTISSSATVWSFWFSIPAQILALEFIKFWSQCYKYFKSYHVDNLDAKAWCNVIDSFVWQQVVSIWSYGDIFQKKYETNFTLRHIFIQWWWNNYNSKVMSYCKPTWKSMRNCIMNAVKKKDLKIESHIISKHRNGLQMMHESWKSMHKCKRSECYFKYIQ